MRQQTVLVISLLLLFVGQAASSEDVDCGAAGDGCASKQWQDFEFAAAKQFPEWPEVGYRSYASSCREAAASLQRLCINSPIRAAKIMKLPP